MLHLDQNHNALSSPHPKPNVILSNTPRPDQHDLLSWSTPNRDERPPFYQEPQDHPVTDKPTNPPINPDVPAASTEAPSEPAAATGPTPSGNVEDPKLSDQPPSTPEVTSPALESTSSLTPPPSATSPAFSLVELPDGESSNQRKVEGTGEEEQTKVDSGGDEGDNASRASTPLSELSSAPGDPLTSEKKPENEGEKPNRDGVDTAAVDANTDPKGGEIKLATVSAESSHSSDILSGADHRMGANSRAPSIATPEPAATSGITSGLPRKSDPKVDVMIELNAELLRVCMELQARGVKLNDPKANQYAGRLQSNLTWMAAAADEHRKFSVHSIPLPPMQPPPPLDFISVERIQQIYKELPELFSKDIIRRRSMSGSGPPGGVVPNGYLKRERPEDAHSDLMSANKRRDTGDSKTSTPAPSTPHGTSSPIQPISATMTQPGTPTHPISVPSLAGSSSGSPSMPPPSVPPGMMSSGNEAQMAAVRARQMQMRQAMQHQSMGDGSRQMPPGGPQQGGMSMPGSSSIPPSTLATLQAMGPSAVQFFQILQNPQHPLHQHMNANTPGFQTLPLQQQIQQMQKFQMMVQARNQQQRAANGQMAAMQGMPQASGGLGGMGMPNGSPTRISSSGQQMPMQQQGGFPFSGGSSGPGGMDPRVANMMGGLTPAQQTTLANMTPQQRQLFLLQQQQQQQQQQMMRGANPVNPMMNQQMYNASQQQRMPGSSPHIGSPMLGGTPDGVNFPAALRSNPGVPGIARSARTPSDHAASPMTPQLSQRGSTGMDDFQRSMMQQAQRNMAQGGHMNQLAMSNAGWPQSQPNHMQSSQGSYGAMSPPGSATGFSGMPGGSPSIGGQQQWSPNASASFQFNTGSPSVPTADLTAPVSRQTSATPAPQQQMAQNSPLPGGDQTGLNDFDLFDWGQ